MMGTNNKTFMIGTVAAFALLISGLMMTFNTKVSVLETKLRMATTLMSQQQQRSAAMAAAKVDRRRDDAKEKLHAAMNVVAKKESSAEDPNKGRCGPLFEGRKCNCIGWEIFCNTDNGWCGNTDAHKNAQEGSEYDCDMFNFFNKLDTNGDSFVDGAEWGKPLYNNRIEMYHYFLGVDDVTDGSLLSKVGPMFKTLDANGDGKLSFDEFSDKERINMFNFFNKLDTNGDKYVDGAEWGKPLYKNRIEMYHYFLGVDDVTDGSLLSKVGPMFTTLDANGDGKLSFDEFSMKGR